MKERTLTVRYFQLPTWKVLWDVPRKKTQNKTTVLKLRNQQQPEKPESRSEMTNLLSPSYEKDEAKALWHNPVKPTASLAFITEKQSQQSCRVSVFTCGAGLHFSNVKFLTVCKSFTP